MGITNRVVSLFDLRFLKPSVNFSRPLQRIAATAQNFENEISEHLLPLSVILIFHNPY
jgi:hypothetical protein